MRGDRTAVNACVSIFGHKSLVLRGRLIRFFQANNERSSHSIQYMLRTPENDGDGGDNGGGGGERTTELLPHTTNQIKVYWAQDNTD